MDRGYKDTAIGEIKARFDKMTAVVFLDYKGMSVENVTKLRAEFRKAGVDYKVVKNTYVKHAIKDQKYKDQLAKTLTGMTGDKLTVKAGLIDGQVLDANAVESQLATMPGKNELRATLLATLQAPLQQFVMLLNAPAQNLVYVLSAKERKSE